MSIRVDIVRRKVDNFSEEAKATLEKQIEKYADDVIKEANIIEEIIREDGASTEVTSNIVLQAVRKNRTYKKKKCSKFSIFMKILSPLSILVTGFLYDSNGYENELAKMAAFICALVVACISTLLQYLDDIKE